MNSESSVLGSFSLSILKSIMSGKILGTLPRVWEVGVVKDGVKVVESSDSSKSSRGTSVYANC